MQPGCNDPCARSAMPEVVTVHAAVGEPEADVMGMVGFFAGVPQRTRNRASLPMKVSPCIARFSGAGALAASAQSVTGVPDGDGD